MHGDCTLLLQQQQLKDTLSMRHESLSSLQCLEQEQQLRKLLFEREADGDGDIAKPDGAGDR